MIAQEPGGGNRLRTRRHRASGGYCLQPPFIQEQLGVFTVIGIVSVLLAVVMIGIGENEIAKER